MRLASIYEIQFVLRGTRIQYLDYCYDSVHCYYYILLVVMCSVMAKCCNMVWVLHFIFYFIFFFSTGAIIFAFLLLCGSLLSFFSLTCLLPFLLVYASWFSAFQVLTPTSPCSSVSGNKGLFLLFLLLFLLLLLLLFLLLFLLLYLVPFLLHLTFFHFLQFLPKNRSKKGRKLKPNITRQTTVALNSWPLIPSVLTSVCGPRRR